QVEPGGGIDLGNHRGLLQRKPCRHRHGVASIDDHSVGHAAAGEQGTDPVADLPAAASTDLADHPRAFQAKNIGHTRWGRIMPRALQQVRAIQARRGHPDTNLSGSTCRRVSLRPLQLPLDTLQCLHAASILFKPATAQPSLTDVRNRLLPSGYLLDRRTPIGRLQTRLPNMRYSLASHRRLPIKRSLAFGILAMFIGLQVTSVLAKPSSPTSSDYQKPERDQVIASLN